MMERVPLFRNHRPYRALPGRSAVEGGRLLLCGEDLAQRTTSVLERTPQLEGRVRVSGRAEEGEALHVIPMQVAEEHERFGRTAFAMHCLAEPTEPGPRIEDQAMSL